MTTIDLDSSSSIAKQLALLKMATDGYEDTEFRSEIETPTKPRKPVTFVNGITEDVEASPAGFTTGHRSFSRSTRRSTSYSHSHSHGGQMVHYREEEGSELREKAEHHLATILNLMTNTSREATALRECWSQINSRRQSWFYERDEYCRQIDELTEELARLADENFRQSHELTEKKTRIEKLLLDLSTAITDVSSYKKKVVEREQDIERLRHELHDSQEKYAHRDAEYQRLIIEYEKAQQSKRTLETERNSFKDSYTKTLRDLQQMTRERDETSARLTDLTNKHEHTRRDLDHLKERIRDIEHERDNLSCELTRNKEEHRRVIVERDEYKSQTDHYKSKEEEARRHAANLEESLRKVETDYATAQSNISSLTERLKHTERERDEATHHSTHLVTETNELKDKIVLLDAEVRMLGESRGKLRLELERFRRERENEQRNHNGFLNDDYRDLEMENERLLRLLKEARAEKERAVNARVSADQERDEANRRYEQKSRQWEEYNERRSSIGGGRYRIMNGISSRKVSGTVPSRSVSHSGTVLNHEVDGANGSHGFEEGRGNASVESQVHTAAQ